MREGSPVWYSTNTQSCRQAREERKERPLSALSVAVGGEEGHWERGSAVVAYEWREMGDNRLDHMTSERERFGRECLSIWSKLKRKEGRRNSGGDGERERERTRRRRRRIEEAPATSVPRGHDNETPSRSASHHICSHKASVSEVQISVCVFV